MEDPVAWSRSGVVPVRYARILVLLCCMPSVQWRISPCDGDELTTRCDVSIAAVGDASARRSATSPPSKVRQVIVNMMFGDLAR